MDFLNFNPWDLGENSNIEIVKNFDYNKIYYCTVSKNIKKAIELGYYIRLSIHEYNDMFNDFNFESEYLLCIRIKEGTTVYKEGDNITTYITDFNPIRLTKEFVSLMVFDILPYDMSTIYETCDWAVTNNHVSLMEKCFENNKEFINIKDDVLLSFAVCHNSLDIVKCLIEKYDLKDKGVFENTLVDISVILKNIDLFKYLILKDGFDVTVKTLYLLKSNMSDSMFEELLIYIISSIELSNECINFVFLENIIIRKSMNNILEALYDNGYTTDSFNMSLSLGKILYIKAFYTKKYLEEIMHSTYDGILYMIDKKER